MHDFYTNALIICLISISVTDWRADQMLWIETMKTQIVICQDKLVVYTHKIIWQISPLLIDLNLTQFGFFRGTKAVLLSMANLHGNRVVRGGIYVHMYLSNWRRNPQLQCLQAAQLDGFTRSGWVWVFIFPFLLTLFTQLRGFPNYVNFHYHRVTDALRKICDAIIRFYFS